MEPATCVQMWGYTAGACGPALRARQASTAASSTEHGFGWSTSLEYGAGSETLMKWKGVCLREKKKSSIRECREFSMGLLIKWAIYIFICGLNLVTRKIYLMGETTCNVNNFIIVSCSEKTWFFCWNRWLFFMDRCKVAYLLFSDHALQIFAQLKWSYRNPLLSQSRILWRGLVGLVCIYW